jgi:SAM-dependent methyltransferase
MSPWYVESFGREYLDLYPTRDAHEARRDVDAILSLLDPPRDAPLLDLGCGAGRHLVALREAGFTRLTGLDLSADLLDVAAARLAAINATTVELLCADMRRIPTGKHFETVLSLFTSFGYFPEDADNRSVLAGVRRALTPDGTVLIDTLNPPYVIDHLVERETRTLSGRTVRIERWVDPERHRVNKRMDVTEADGTQRRFDESVRMYGRDEFVAMLAGAGFGGIHVYGSLRGAVYSSESERLVLVAQGDG